jgi:hypothetical protein
MCFGFCSVLAIFFLSPRGDAYVLLIPHFCRNAAPWPPLVQCTSLVLPFGIRLARFHCCLPLWLLPLLCLHLHHCMFILLSRHACLRLFVPCAPYASLRACRPSTQLRPLLGRHAATWPGAEARWSCPFGAGPAPALTIQGRPASCPALPECRVLLEWLSEPARPPLSSSRGDACDRGAGTAGMPATAAIGATSKALASVNSPAWMAKGDGEGVRVRAGMSFAVIVARAQRAALRYPNILRLPITVRPVI